MRNCITFLVKKKKKSNASALGMFIIKVNLSSITSWVMDTRYRSHIYTNV